LLVKCRNRAQLHKSLSTLPPTLDETYERILCAIPEEDAEYAIRILRWLAFAKRPLRLNEIAEIVAFDPRREIPFDENEVLEDPLEVMDICSSLVSMTSGSVEESDEKSYWSNGDSSDKHNIAEQAIVLAHYSVQEYLTSPRCVNGQASKYAMDEAVCHMLISESCLSSLLFSFQRNEEVGNLALWDYSAQFWTIHAEKGHPYARWTELAVILFSNSSFLLQWVRIYCPDELYEDEHGQIPLELLPQGLYFASLSGFVEVAVQLIQIYNVDINAQGGMLGNALQAASYGGHKALVELLLSRGADINAQGGLYDNALQGASCEGHLETAKLLCSKGADINAQGGHQSTALSAAASGGHLKIVNFLISKGAEIYAGGNALRGRGIWWE
jgi:Ankyrin repeats (3 copies)